jgi:hypothetical protein
MQRKTIRLGAAVTALACSIGGVALAAPATAAQSDMPITCDGQQLIVRTNENNSSDMGGWESVQVVSGGSGHLTPTTFSGALVDETVGQTIFQFSQSKGGGHGNHTLPTVSCEVVTPGTLGDFLPTGETPPPGTSTSDAVKFTIDVSAIVSN